MQCNKRGTVPNPLADGSIAHSVDDSAQGGQPVRLLTSNLMPQHDNSQKASAQTFLLASSSVQFLTPAFDQSRRGGYFQIWKWLEGVARI